MTSRPANVLRERDTGRVEIAWLHAALSEHIAEIDRLRRDLAERDRLIAAIYASESWRLAAPLRGAAALMRRLVGRLRGTQPSVAPRPSPAVRPSLPPPVHFVASEPPVRSASLGTSRGTILVAADILPLFDQSSGGLRLKTIIGMMAESGWSIVFGSLDERDHQPGVLATPEGRARYEAVLQQTGVIRFLYGPGEIGSFLAEAGRDLSWAFLSFPRVAAELLPLVRSYCRTTRIAYDMVDFHGLRMAREAALNDDAELMAAAERQRAVEIACARGADVTIAVTEAERAALLDMASDVVAEVLPNLFEKPPHASPGPGARDGLLFVGGFWHKPNGDAVHWFVDRIWPLIRREAPDLVLRIAGANADNALLALGALPGIEVLGFVPDLTPLYDRHRVFIAPLRYGAGMKGKVGQSLMHGLPVVATPIGAEGMGLHDGVHLLVAEQEEDFAAQVLRLLRDDGLWTQLAAEGRAHIERTLSVDAVRPRLEALLRG
jgi:hypothetical protein